MPQTQTDWVIILSDDHSNPPKLMTRAERFSVFPTLGSEADVVARFTADETTARLVMALLPPPDRQYAREYQALIDGFLLGRQTRCQAGSPTHWRLFPLTGGGTPIVVWILANDKEWDDLQRSPQASLVPFSIEFDAPTTHAALIYAGVERPDQLRQNDQVEAFRHRIQEAVALLQSDSLAYQQSNAESHSQSE